jgi:chaperonin GroEL
MATLLREPATPGRDERLRRLCVAAGCLPDKAKALASTHTDFSAEYALGLASPYFVTDANTMECRLKDAHVAVFGEALNDLELLVRLLGRIAAAGRPLLILAPSVSDEVLAICVVNKLRGIIQCAVAISRTPSEDPGAMLAEVAKRTGAQVVTQAEARRVQGQGFLGRAATVRARPNGITVTPARP